MSVITKIFLSIDEQYPGEKWLSFYKPLAGGYKKWFLSEGDKKRPTFNQSKEALLKYMPELLPLWEHLIKLTKADEEMSRMLSLYCPPVYKRGCSQAVWTRYSPVLVRNYDYAPQLCEGRLLKSKWFDTEVIAMTDCLWGALDGINEHGLCVSLAYGGSNITGKGFAIPLVVRYVLEFCKTTQEAIEKFKSIPVNMSYNITILDSFNHVTTIELSPIEEPKISTKPFAVNKQGDFDLNEYTIFSNSLEKEKVLAESLFNPLINIGSFVDAFQYAPLFSLDYANNFGTLYTAIYNPYLRATEYRWPGQIRLYQSFAYFIEQETWITY